MLNERGSLACLENKEGDEISFCEVNNCQDAQKVCLKAAKHLKECAARFELLSVESDPFNEDTQSRINRIKITA